MLHNEDGQEKNQVVLEELKRLGKARMDRSRQNKFTETRLNGVVAAQEDLEDVREKKKNPPPITQNAQVEGSSHIEQKSEEEEKSEVSHDDNIESPLPEQKPPEALIPPDIDYLAEEEKALTFYQEQKQRQTDVKDIKQGKDKPPVKIDRDKFILQQKTDLVAFIADLDAKQKAAFDAFIETQEVIQKASLVDFYAKQSATKKAALDSYTAQQTAALDAFDQAPRSNVNDKKNIIVPVIDINDFMDPITGDPIEYPIVVHPCGHLFEEASLSTWIEQEKRTKEHARCPLCRKEILKLHPPTEHFFNKLHKEFLEKNPTLRQVTFNLASLNDCLIASDSEIKTNRQLNILINSLKKSPVLLNTVSVEEGFEGYTAVTILAGHPLGLKILKELRKNIQPTGLNAIGNYGLSAVYYLISNLKAMSVVDLELCGKISSDALNAIVMRPGETNDGATAVTFLAWRLSEKEGRNLLAEYPTLCNLIQPQGLNAIVIENGEKKGDSALYWFAKSLHKHNFFTSSILNMISEEAFNAIRPDGTSALYFFTYFEKGRQLLLANPELCALMTQKALFTEPQSLQVGLYDIKKKTPADWLTQTATGQKILARNPDLQKKIGYSFNLKKLNDLLDRCTDNEDDSDQKELGLMIAFLKESKEVMNMEDKNYHGLTATHVLVSHKKGLDLLLANPDLRGMIQSKGLNAVCEMKQKPKSSFPWFKPKEINYHSLSAVYWLMKSPKGRDILLADNARLFSLITSNAFYRAIETEPDQGKTPYSWLKDSPKLKALYEQRSDLVLSRQVKLSVRPAKDL